MKRLKNARIIVINILLVCSLLAAAFCVPALLIRVTDSYSLGQVNTQKLEMDAYELTYRNFAEKVSRIASVQAQGRSIEMIQLSDDTDELWADELTEYVMYEVDLLLKDALEIDITLQEKDLRERKLYMLYSNGGGGNLLAGIQLYELVYRVEGLGYDDVELVFYMDTEFHKLYRFSVSSLEANIAPEVSDPLVEKVIIAWEKEMDVVLPLDELVDYWELEENYQVSSIRGEDALWKGSKQSVGKSSEDYLLLGEDGVPLSVWSTLVYDNNLFAVAMGLYFGGVATNVQTSEYDG